MSNYKRLHIPHMISEFDDNMLKPLHDNFSEVQRHVSITQARVELLESQVEAIIAALSTST